MVAANRFFISTDVGNASIYSECGANGKVLKDEDPYQLFLSIYEFFESDLHKNFQSTDLKLETLEAQASRLVRLYTNVLEKVE